jgi:hypothetical protein
MCSGLEGGIPSKAFKKGKPAIPQINQAAMSIKA